MKNFLISEKDLRELLNGYLHYVALESGGVDNWDWYGESIRDFLRENEVKHFKDLIEKELKEYEVVT